MLRLVPPPSRPHFLSPALRTRDFSTFPFPSSGSGPGKFHKGLVSAVDSFSRAICSCQPLCWCCPRERLEKALRSGTRLPWGCKWETAAGPRSETRSSITETTLQLPPLHHPQRAERCRRAASPPAVGSICYKNPCEPEQGVPVGDVFPVQTWDEKQELTRLLQAVQHPPEPAAMTHAHPAAEHQLQVRSRPAKPPSSQRLFLLRFPSSTASPSPSAG